MSDTSRAADAVSESVAVLTDSLEWVPDELSGDGEGDTSPGRAVGARIGGEIGAVLGRSVGELVAAGLQEGNSSDDVLEEVREFLVAVFSELLTDADADSALAEIRETARSLPEETGEEATDEEGTGEDESSADDDSAAEAESEADGTEAADEAEEGESEADGEDGAGVTSPEELDNLREETLREILDLMSYDELQSIAKKVGVKANLDTETMRERIVEEFTAEEGSGDGEDSTDESDE
ncbi:hypothetical protein [Haloarcula nitratireducens]|uniref:Uncharacterized protein n=1 Tax=Haloarcula nitratireducens TaxID=2487749 RepID=A0AAW4PBR5_9EURY|nr:hypothetical protein [Halomicroarcula nitratireducens]MBX0295334.1 hypothetical protein [Halomicroarcula nitratireducens]